MTAQIPSDWHPDSYVVDESDKVVWKLGSFPADRNLYDQQFSLIPGYRIGLCDQEELAGVRRIIKTEEAKRAAEPSSKADEEIKYGPEAEGWAWRMPEPQPKRAWFTKIDVKPYLLPISIVLLAITQIPAMRYYNSVNTCIW